MYANTSEQFNFNQISTSPTFHENVDHPRETWWNRSVGPLVLTTLLAPVALTLMASGFTLVSILAAIPSVLGRLQMVSTVARPSVPHFN